MQPAKQAAPSTTQAAERDGLLAEASAELQRDRGERAADQPADVTAPGDAGQGEADHEVDQDQARRRRSA